MKKTAVIVNPHAGTGAAKRVGAMLKAKLDNGEIQCSIIETQGPGDANRMAAEAVNLGYDRVIICGGDGTVNEAARALAHTSVELGIIPIGSGNGFARSLAIPVNAEKAVDVAFGSSKIRVTDMIRCNQTMLVGLAGIGFDATVADKFDQSGKRGLWQYVRIVLSELKHRKSFDSEIILSDGKSMRVPAMMLDVCNTGQFGNETYISPESLPDDGQLELMVIAPMKWYQILGFASRILFKSVHKSRHVRLFTGTKFEIITQENLMHHDGEPIHFDGNARFEISPDTLKVVVTP
jgi:diacylglycerol kinase (ATP)